MARKNVYNPQVHPVIETMNQGTQTGRLYGKMNIASPKKDEKVEYVIIDGNGTDGLDNIMDGNFLDNVFGDK